MLKRALRSRSDALGLGCVDTRKGAILELETKHDVDRGVVELAALSALELCSMPQEGEDGLETVDADDVFLASRDWLRAYARVPDDRHLVVVGLASAEANVGLFRSWVKSIARELCTTP